jgi:uncharacterized protein YecE (DUF72 family)
VTPQTDLFGFVVPDDDTTGKPTVRASSRGAVTPAPQDAATITLGQRLPDGVHLGTSSWSFSGWSGLVYAGAHTDSKLARDGLAAYAAHPLFRTVSIDRTFYAPLSEKEFADYAAKVPMHFRFVVKAPMAITSSYVRDDAGRFSDSPFYLDLSYAIDNFVAPAANGLGANAGPLVFQFPPQGKRITSNPDSFINQLYRFLRDLPPGLRYAVEVRDTELLTTRFFKCLETTNVSFCVASHARMPSPAEQIARMSAHLPEGDFICRWSLHAGFKYEDAKERYAPFDRIVDEDIESRMALAAAVASAARGGRVSFVTINNKAEGSAPHSVRLLAEAISRAMSPTSAPSSDSP